MNLNDLRRRRQLVQNRFFIAVIYLTDPRNWNIFLLKTSWKTKLTLKNLTGYPLASSTFETSWLDGLRGMAAFFVMTSHYGSDLYWPYAYEAPYGSTMIDFKGKSSGPPFTQFWRLPIVRIFMTSGHTQVSIFFVLSGFVLSWGALGKIQKGDTSKLVGSLASATLRRWLRLYLPCFVVASFGCVVAYVTLAPNAPLKRESFRAQVWDLIVANEVFGDWTKLHRVGFAVFHPYNAVMWTMPLEFEGSMLVFLLLLAISRVRQFWKRTAIIGYVSAYSYHKAHWTYWLFSSGVLLANYVRHMGGFKKLAARQTRTSSSFWCLSLLVALLLMGNPQKNEPNNFTRPGYEWLDSLVPFNWLHEENGSRIWFCWSGLLFVACAIHLPAMQRVYNMRFPRYLGYISFMLYLTHRILSDTFGKALRFALCRQFGRGNYINETAGTIVGGNPLLTFFMYAVIMLFQMPTALLVAYWVTVWVDEPIVRFARSVDSWLTTGGEEQEESLQAEARAESLPRHYQDVLLSQQELGSMPVLVMDEVEDEQYKEVPALLATQIEMTQVTVPDETIPQRRKEDDSGLV
ncbi:hypothetical protein DOTSEDRAFT_74343 [Dothistroma septosporum NZE10]|uniref:Acyltransferase 3 domain-containing protein n=1 Tax=Dothistroma septosporum (strain NZE10 / CBS 128990) TaxID=675120 RepID=N1PGV7_DOTSN|nr:hypothetical protein DOTSEDRAFT_74343 [Dothistroma septosporum NZE10]